MTKSLLSEAAGEVWRPAPECKKYEVSNLGSVRSYAWGAAPRALKPFPNAKGYLCVHIHPDNGEKRQHWLVHRLVWIAFHGPIPSRREINHIDGVKANNALANIELVTRSENIKHAHRTGLKVGLAGERSPNAKLTEAAVRIIRERHARGDRVADIARDYGVSPPLISYIHLRRAWAHVQ